MLTDVFTDIPLTPIEKTELLSQLYKESGDYTERKELMAHAAPGTCAWVLEHESFLEWQHAEGSCLLWITAEAGCGKTVLADYLIENIRRGPDDIVAYYFFKGGEKQRATQALCGLLHQILIRRDSATRHLVESYRTAGKGNQIVYELTTLWNLLETSSSDGKSSRVICVIDALDECVDRGAVLRHLKATFGRPPHCKGEEVALKIIVTSRPYPEINEGFRSVPKIRLKAEDESVKTAADIQMVVQIRLAELRDPGPGLRSDFSEELLVELADLIPQKAGRTFLWVRLIFDIIAASSSHTRQHIQKLVQQMPVSLDEMYGNSLAATDDPGSTDKLLRVMFSAMRSLTLAEVNVALCFDPESPSVGSLELEVEIERRVRMTCCILLTINNKRVDFIHHTAREYLVCTDTSIPRSGPGWRQTLSGVAAHGSMAKICISYLAAPDWNDFLKVHGCYRNSTASYYAYKAQLSMSTTEWWAPLALVKYAASTWSIHHSASKPSPTLGVGDVILQICDPSSGIYECWAPHFRGISFKIPSPARLVGLDKHCFLSSALWVHATERRWIPLASEWCDLAKNVPNSLILGSQCRLRSVQLSSAMLDRVFHDALQTDDTRLLQYLFIDRDSVTHTDMCDVSTGIRKEEDYVHTVIAAFDFALKQKNNEILAGLHSEDRPMRTMEALLSAVLEWKNPTLLLRCLTWVDYHPTVLKDALKVSAEQRDHECLSVLLDHSCKYDDQVIFFSASVQRAVKISLVYRDAKSLLLLLNYLRDYDDRVHEAHAESTTNIWTLSSVISETLDEEGETSVNNYSDKQRLFGCIWKAIFKGASLQVEIYSKLLSAMFRANLLKGKAAEKDRCKHCSAECLSLRRYIVEAAICWRDDLIPLLARAQQMCHCVEDGPEHQSPPLSDDQSAAAPSIRGALRWVFWPLKIRSKRTLELRNVFTRHNLLGAQHWEDPKGYVLATALVLATTPGPGLRLPSKYTTWAVPYWPFALDDDPGDGRSDDEDFHGDGVVYDGDDDSNSFPTI